MKAPRQARIAPAGADYDIRVLGVQATPLRDFYHALVRLPWSVTFLVIALAYVGANALFACIYLVVGGLANARTGGFAEAFFFSVQTMGTIGYGAIYPETFAANCVVVAESIVGLIVTALATGLVFAKFSRPTARVVFMRKATISRVDRVPTLAFRLGNERGNRIVDAQIRAVMARTEHTAEGHSFYRHHDLKLGRDRIVSLARSFSVRHVIDEASPLHGLDAASFAALECELHVIVTGTDDTTMQPVHALHSYYARDILWNARPVDILSEDADGNMVLDLRRFHDTEPTPQ